MGGEALGLVGLGLGGRWWRYRDGLHGAVPAHVACELHKLCHPAAGNDVRRRAAQHDHGLPAAAASNGSGVRGERTKQRPACARITLCNRSKSDSARRPRRRQRQRIAAAASSSQTVHVHA